MAMASTTPRLRLGAHWMALLRRFRWMTHPITIFVSLQIVWLAITLIWVIWFVGAQQEIASLAQRFGREVFDSRVTVSILVVGCVLLGVLLVGTITLFVFGQRQSYQARQHRNFVSSVTHELKSPLASLQLSFETMTSRELDPPTSARLMRIIDTDIERLRRLVDQILVAGRLDRGALGFDDEVLDLDFRQLINSVQESLIYLDPAVGSRLEIECEPGTKIRAPRQALLLILNNLLENAVKYSPRESRITVACTDGPNETFFYVRDQGYGLDKKDMRRIFKMFHRSESAVKKAIPGTGLGLYIVKSAVRVLGGRVWVESPGRNKGTTFYVSLPKAPAVSRKGRDGYA
jgi:signal transduction histidine kinase